MFFNKRKFVIALVCTFVGWVVGFQMGRQHAEENCRDQRQFGIFPFFNELPFNPWEPHGEEREDKEQGHRGFFERFFGFNGDAKGGQGHGDQENNESQMELQEEDSLWRRPFSMFNHTLDQPKMNTREDEHFVYMEIDLKSFDQKSLNAKVEGQTVVIEGDQKREEEGSSFTSHFFQSLPAPMGTDPSKVEMSHENNKLVLKFPKVKEK